MKEEQVATAALAPKLPLLSEVEAARWLGVSRITLLRARKRCEIGHYRVGARVLYSEEHLRQYLANVERHPRWAAYRRRA
jgi:excisionase family DNA binding protein